MFEIQLNFNFPLRLHSSNCPYPTPHPACAYIYAYSVYVTAEYKENYLRLYNAGKAFRKHATPTPRSHGTVRKQGSLLAVSCIRQLAVAGTAQLSCDSLRWYSHIRLSCLRSC